jgi:hypothetical protein
VRPIFPYYCGLEFRSSAKPNLKPLPSMPNVGENLQPGGGRGDGHVSEGSGQMLSSSLQLSLAILLLPDE